MQSTDFGTALLHVDVTTFSKPKYVISVSLVRLYRLVQAVMLVSDKGCSASKRILHETPVYAQTQVDTTIPGNPDKSDTSWLSVAVLMSYQRMGIANFVRPYSMR